MSANLENIKMLILLERPLMDSPSNVLSAVLDQADFMMKQTREFEGPAKQLMQEVALNMRRDAQMEIALRN